MIEHRIADPRVLSLIRQWFAAGVFENSVYAETVEGTPQGSEEKNETSRGPAGDDLLKRAKVPLTDGH